jgi:hypothetical protein
MKRARTKKRSSLKVFSPFVPTAELGLISDVTRHARSAGCIAPGYSSLSFPAMLAVHGVPYAFPAAPNGCDSPNIGSLRAIVDRLDRLGLDYAFAGGSIVSFLLDLAKMNR